MTENQGDMFNAFYYQTGCGRPYRRDEEWLRSFDAIAARIVEEFHPKTVLDAGCAMGFLVEGLRKRGVEAYGVDISEYAIANVDPSIRPYCRVGSIVEPFQQRYDLIVTIEVVEHMPKEEADKAIANFCEHTDEVLFCSGFQDFKEVTHVNLHPPEYWAAQFARHGFFRDVDFDGSFLTPWTVRFKKNQAPIHQIIMDYERRMDHLFQENAGVRQMNLEQRNSVANMEQELTKLRYISAEQVEQVKERDETIHALIKERDQAVQTLTGQLTAVKNELEAVRASRTFRAAARLRSFLPPFKRPGN